MGEFNVLGVEAGDHLYWFDVNGLDSMVLGATTVEEWIVEYVVVGFDESGTPLCLVPEDLDSAPEDATVLHPTARAYKEPLPFVGRICVTRDQAAEEWARDLARSIEDCVRQWDDDLEGITEWRGALQILAEVAGEYPRCRAVASAFLNSTLKRLKAFVVDLEKSLSNGHTAERNPDG